MACGRRGTATTICFLNQKGGRFKTTTACLAGQPARDTEHHFGGRFGGRRAVVPGHKGLHTVAHRLDAQLQAAVAVGECSDPDADEVRAGHRPRLRHALAGLAGTGTWPSSTPRRTSGS